MSRTTRLRLVVMSFAMCFGLGANCEGQRQQPPRTESPTPVNAPIVATRESVEAPSVARALAPWTDADKCIFPPVAPPEGTTAKQCCTPLRELEVCLETASTVHLHEMGPYTKRTLRVVRRPEGEVVLTLPLDRYQHGSMRSADAASVLLAFRIEQSGLDVSLREAPGCKASCIATNDCTGESKRVAELCQSVGAYAWDGQRLSRTSARP